MIKGVFPKRKQNRWNCSDRITASELDEASRSLRGDLSSLNIIDKEIIKLKNEVEKWSFWSSSFIFEYFEGPAAKARSLGARNWKNFTKYKK